MDKDKLKVACDQGSKCPDDFVDCITYCYNDVANTINAYYGLWPYRPKREPNQLINLNLMITKVIFNDPATIIYWSDNTRTVVKCSKDDIYDPEKGMAMAICKKILGYRFKEIFKEYLPEEETSSTGIAIGTVTKIEQDSNGVKVKAEITNEEAIEAFKNAMTNAKKAIDAIANFKLK